MSLHEDVKTRIFYQLREEGFEVSRLPANNDGAHAEVRWNKGRTLRIHVRVRETSKAGNYANFKNISLPEQPEGFFFVFCSEELGKMWLMSAQEFLRITGRKKGINFRGKQQDISGDYEVQNFARLKCAR